MGEAETASAREAAEGDRLRALTDVTRAFAEATVDYRQLLDVVVRRTAEAIGDFCALALVSDDGRWLIPTTAFDRDAVALSLLRRIFGDRPASLEAPHPTHARAIHAGESVLLTEVDPAVIASRVDPEDLATAFGLKIKSLLMVPLRVHGRSLGALTLLRHGEAARPLDERDLALAEALAAHAAIALTNAHLLASERAARVSLEQAEARFRALVEHSADGVSLTDARGVTFYRSPAVLRLLGYSEGEDPGPRGLEAVHPDDRAAVRANYTALLAEPGSTRTQEQRSLHRNGSWRWMEVTMTNRLDDPAVGAIVSNGRDVTERRLMLDQLRASEARYRRFIETTSEGVWTLDANQCLSFANARITALLGYDDPAQLVGQHVDAFLDAEGRVGAAERHKLRRAGVGGQVEVRLRRRDGSALWVLVESTPIFDAEGRYEGVLAMAMDITARRAFEAEQARLAAIVESCEDAILGKDLDGRITNWNDGAEKLYGYTRDEVLGRSASVLTRADHPDEESQLLARVARGERVVHFETVRVCRDGTHVPVSLSVSPIRDTEGRVVGVSSIARDLTAQHRAAAAQAESANVQQLFFESSPVPIVLFDAATLAFVAVNDAATALYGYGREEFLTLRLLDLRMPEEQTSTETGLREGNNEGWRGNSTHRRKDGSILQVEILSRPHRLNGRLVRMAAMLDVTDKLRLETQLRQSQKMEAVGRLAGGVAHDFNNLLSVILGYADLTLSDLRPDDPIRDDLAEIRRAAERAAGLTHQLLAFSRQQVLNPRVLDLAAVVAGTEKMLRRLVGEDVQLSLLAAPGLGHCKVDPGQVEQVVMNLVVNARDAMPMGGRLTIAISAVELDDTYAAEHLEVAPGPYLLLSVSDTGSGMDKATRARIFEPFFTTKEKGKGTGLGLSTVFGIVKQSAGHLTVYSEPGVGTTFKVYFPRVTGDVEPVPVTAPATTTRGTETVLLVEDEEAVRALACTVLRRNGYHVLDAANAGEALLHCEQFGARIHLLITDVIMPQMSGRLLAARLAPMRPDMRVLYMSGYTEDAIVHHGVLDAGIDFLPKPLTPTALLKKVREVLDAPTIAARG